MSDSLWPHGLQHARLLCPAPSPIGCWNSCPLSCWCYLTISSYVAHVSSCPQSFPASGCFPMRRLFTSGGQSIGASATVLPMNQLSSVQSLSHVQLFATLWTTVHQASLSITNSQSLFKLISIESVMPFNHHILCRPLLLLSVLPASGSFQMSQLFISGSQSLSNEYSRLISRMDWLDLLAVSLKGLSRVFSNTTVQRINSLVLSFLFSPTVTSIQRLLKKS